MKRVLCIDRRDARLELDGAALRVRLPDQAPQTVPLALLERVLLISDTQLHSSLLAALAEAGVGLVALGGRGGQRVAHLLGAPHSDARIRLAQALAVNDAEQRRRFASHFVHGKLRAQRKMLREALDCRAELRRALLAAIDSLDRAINRLRNDTLADDALRGLEGAAAAAYFRAYAELFPERLGFRLRLRRPPPDPVNVCLSLGYTLAIQSAIHACWTAGLDAGIGFLHSPSHGRPALACDLLEVCRPIVDRFTWQLFRDEVLRPEHFGQGKGSPCLLGKAGRGHYYAAWASLRPDLDTPLRRQARSLRRVVQRQADELPDWESPEQ